MPASLPPSPKGAVFLSYASQDAEAARRICEALRAAGVEVWFDQNELVGGDAWDAKIRKQIGSCALFVPVISANTQARLEGYFRLEWKLAEDRSHLMAKGRPFIVPVTIDATSEREAQVPDSFLAVQWTRLVSGETPAKFCEQVKSLLDSSVAPTRVVGRSEGYAISPAIKTRRAIPLVAWAALLVLAGAGVLFSVKRSEPSSSLSSVNTPKPASVVEKAAPLPQTEAQRLIAQIWRIFELQEDGTVEEWTLAEDLGAQAVKLEPTNAEAWAAYSVAGWGLTSFWSASAPIKREDALRRAERAATLAPDSDNARFALANLRGADRRTNQQAEESLRDLLRRRPDDKRVLRLLAYTLRNRARWSGDPTARAEEAIGYLDRAAALPGGDAAALTGKCSVYTVVGRYEEALAAAEASAALRNGAGAAYWKTGLQLYLVGDPDKAAQTIDAAPPAFWRQERNIVLVSRVQLAQKQPRLALGTLARLPNAWVDGGITFSGPKGLLTGEARMVAGDREAAQEDFRAALAVVDRRLASAVNDSRILYWKCWLLAALGESAEAQRAFVLWQQYSNFSPNDDLFLRYGSGAFRLIGSEPAALFLKFGDKGRVLEGLERMVAKFAASNLRGDALILRNRLRLDPTWDPLRGEPRFDLALAQLANVPAAESSKKKNSL